MKELFETPELEIIEFSNIYTDVIVESITGGEGGAGSEDSDYDLDEE